MRPDREPPAAEPAPGPILSPGERDRRWRAVRALMSAQALDAVIVGSFQGRERLESYLIDDFLDSIVVFPLVGEPTVLAFSTSRISRAFESAARLERACDQQVEARHEQLHNRRTQRHARQQTPSREPAPSDRDPEKYGRHTAHTRPCNIKV